VPVVKLAAVLVAVAAIAGPVEGASAQAPDVRVRLGSRALSLTADQVRAAVDVPPTPYTLRDPGGDQTVELSGLSVAGLVRLAGGDPATVRELTVPRARAGFVRLSGADLADPSPFPEGPPLVFVDGSSVRFFRPVRGPADSNAQDNLASQPGDGLQVTVLSGPPLAVQASADRPRARSAQPVTFSAAVQGGGGELAYEWRFDDGTTGRGARIEHAFRGPGRYRVVVTAAGADGSGGTSEPVLVDVGGRRTATARGRGRDGDSGQGAGERPGASGRDAPGTGRSPDAGDRQASPGVTSPGPISASPPSAPSEPPARGVAPPDGRGGRTAPRRRSRRASRASAAGRRVSGVLLTETAATVAAPAAAPPATRLGARQGSEGGDSSLALVALALGLIAGGAGAEGRRRPRSTGARRSPWSP